MYIYFIQINEERNELISKEKLNKVKLVERYITGKDMADFYEDNDKFIKENCIIKVREGYKSLYLISTNQSGYDTYDSAVYCAYTEKQAIQLSEENMGSSYKPYTNLARMIGTAEDFMEIGEVVSSFNAG